MRQHARALPRPEPEAGAGDRRIRIRCARAKWASPPRAGDRAPLAVVGARAEPSKATRAGSCAHGRHLRCAGQSATAATASLLLPIRISSMLRCWQAAGSSWLSMQGCGWPCGTRRSRGAAALTLNSPRLLAALRQPCRYSLCWSLTLALEDAQDLGASHRLDLQAVGCGCGCRCGEGGWLACGREQQQAAL